MALGNKNPRGKNTRKGIYPNKDYDQILADLQSRLDKQAFNNTPIGQFLNQPNQSSSVSDQVFRGFYKDMSDYGGSEADQLLAALLKNYYAEKGAVTNERNDMFYQYLLQLISTKDQRNFDLQQLQDSRLYQDPLNQLGRLMGAGISRDAAIQLMSGAAGGSGVGVAGSGAGSSAPGVSAPSGTMDLQNRQFAVQTTQAAVAMLTQLMDTGMNLAQGISQVNLMNSQNFMSQQDIQAYQASQQMYMALNNAINTGAISQDDVNSWSNAQDMLNYFFEHKETKSFKPVFDNGSYDFVTSSLSGQRAFNDQWHQLRNSRDVGTLADEFIRSQKLSNAIASLQPQLVGAELEKIGVETKAIYQNLLESASRIALNEAQIQVLDKQGNWLDVQSDSLRRTTDSQINLMDTQAYSQDIQNKQLLLNYEYNEAGFAVLKQNRIDQIQNEALKWSCIKDPVARDNQIKAWLLEPANAFDTAYLKSLHLNAVGDFANYNPGLYSFLTVMNGTGAFDLVRESSGLVNSAIKGFNLIK